MKQPILLAAALLAGQQAAQGQELQQLNPQQATFHQHLIAQDAARRAGVDAFLKSNPQVPERFTDRKGHHYLHHISADGKPVYWSTRSNLGLATSVRTNRLWSGGAMGLQLDGQNMEVSASRSRLGVWEPGAVRATHQEFGGRAITRDLPVFTAPNGETDHATHVAGTMVAGGTQANAHGMAAGAKIDCYETGTDETAEMLLAGAQGMVVSNHSYGPTFNANNPQPNGVYDDECKTYDSIVVSNKYYLPVMAAGNDRDESANIQYDILVGGANAKNLLSVAAVRILGPNGYTGPASVEISDFSSFGPADDGRVKPDISAPGVQIYSAGSGSNTDYKTEDGTSMASPGVAGSLFLLQQHHRNMTGSDLRASTLKGLALHTADETGIADGPDYSYGWGLLNTEKAVNVLRNDGNMHLMEEATLASGVEYRKYFGCAGGPVKATICWTDITGEVLGGQATNDRSPMLRNDLDLRVVDSATNQVVATLPWKLDPDQPAAAATRGDNTVDNVEIISIANLPAGKYYLRVTNKGSLAGGNQEFAVFASGIAAPTGIHEAAGADGRIFISPVPATSAVRIVNTAPSLLGTTAVIFDVQGRAMHRFTLAAGQEIDVRAWPAGSYLLRLADGSAVRIAKH